MIVSAYIITEQSYFVPKDTNERKFMVHLPFKNTLAESRWQGGIETLTIEV